MTKESQESAQDRLAEPIGILTPEGVLWLIPLWPAGQGKN